MNRQSCIITIFTFVFVILIYFLHKYSNNKLDFIRLNHFIRFYEIDTQFRYVSHARILMWYIVKLTVHQYYLQYVFPPVFLHENTIKTGWSELSSTDELHMYWLSKCELRNVYCRSDQAKFWVMMLLSKYY